MNQLCSPRRLHPVNSRAYSIEKLNGAKWEKVAFAISTHEADKMIAQKTRFESGRFRAIEVKAA